VTEFTKCMHERSNAGSAKKEHVSYAGSVLQVVVRSLGGDASILLFITHIFSA